MKHWTEGFDDDGADESLVRPYTITGGRTAPERDDLTLITLVTATVRGASPETDAPAQDAAGAPRHPRPVRRGRWRWPRSPPR